MLNHFRFNSSGCSVVAIALLILPRNCYNYFHLKPEICNSNMHPYIVGKSKNQFWGNFFLEFHAPNFNIPWSPKFHFWAKFRQRRFLVVVFSECYSKFSNLPANFEHFSDLFSGKKGGKKEY